MTLRPSYRAIGAFAAFLLLGGLGCVSSRVLDQKATQLFKNGKYQASAEQLKRSMDKHGLKGRDRLLYLMDLGLAYYEAGDFQKSIKVFLEADKLAEIKDYTNIATEGATLITGDNLKDYKGEEFEKVLINTYLALGFALSGKLESALVEARRVNRKLYMMKSKGGRKYQQNAFARYLAGVLYEMESEWNDAYISYKKVKAIDPSFPWLGRDLFRVAERLGIYDEKGKWVREFGLSPAQQKEALKSLDRKRISEIVVIYQNGISPEKRPNPKFEQLPKFYPRYNPADYARIKLNGVEVGQTAVLHDIEAIAIQNLDEKYGAMIAKKVGGVVLKESIAYGLGRAAKSEAVWFLSRMALYAIDRADLRSWNLLPRDLQIARFAVVPGEYEIRVLPEGGGNPLPAKKVKVGAGKKALVSFRFLP